VEINFFFDGKVCTLFVTEEKAISLHMHHAICPHITTVEVRVRIDLYI
jgi:hypothetical protein